MILLPPDLRAALHTNAASRLAALRDDRPEPDPLPVVKFFAPAGAATWLASELDADGDTLFGLADLGFGCPELGMFSLAELQSIRLPGGLGIERDLYFAPRFPLSVYADAARIAGRITEGEALLATAARARDLLASRNPDIPSTRDG